MKKGALIEKVRQEVLQNGLLSNDDLGRYSFRKCELDIQLIWADAIAILVRDSASLDFFSKTYDGYDHTGIDIVYDQDRKEYYINLPVNILQLPANAGVCLVKPHGATNRRFYPSNNAKIDLMSDLDNKYYDRTLYVLDGQDRLRIVFFDYASRNVRKVTLKLIPDFLSYGYDEEVNLPSGKNVEFFNILA
ncbi:MAG: hypothetical protein ACYC5G_04425, partial [Candidatus Doudnabacteria bacterium]